MPIHLCKNLWHFSKYFLAFATLALAGCATSQQTAQSGDSSVREGYLSRTTSDPLGAYLASDTFNRQRQYPFNPAAKQKSIANTALKLLGVKYKFGGGTPDTGFDCSGLVKYVAEKSLGLKLPRVSAEIAQLGKPVEQSELKKGDLVFFNTRGRRFSHVGIYLGNQEFVHAPRSGSVVRVESMDIAYWKKRYNGARRLPTDVDANTMLALN